jgi:hypothetical protein
MWVPWQEDFSSAQEFPSNSKRRCTQETLLCKAIS